MGSGLDGLFAFWKLRKPKITGQFPVELFRTHDCWTTQISEVEVGCFFTGICLNKCRTWRTLFVLVFWRRNVWKMETVFVWKNPHYWKNENNQFPPSPRVCSIFWCLRLCLPLFFYQRQAIQSNARKSCPDTLCFKLGATRSDVKKYPFKTLVCK